VTTTAPETVDLATAASNGSPQAKRRGRPPGSKNKPKDTEQAAATPKKRGRPRKSAATPRKTTARRRVTTPQPEPKIPTAVENHAILIENDGLVVIRHDGSSYHLHAPVIVDRRKA
jgi:hemin uptake protein HemP